MARNILFVTTDQQRFDSLGCNGGTIARTPVADALARDGINYQRGYNNNTVCMPARCTMLTGQYPRTHGVVANGIALPTDAERRRSPQDGRLSHGPRRQGPFRAGVRHGGPLGGEPPVATQ